MADPSLIILYVDDVARSAAFYEALLGTKPAEASPGFAMIPLAGVLGLGLWARGGVAPAAGPAGGSELAFAVRDVDATHADWSARGLPIAQAPTTMDFGRCCVALDPDGHRVRAFTPMA